MATNLDDPVKDILEVTNNRYKTVKFQFGKFCQCIQCFTPFIQSHVFNIMYIYDIHVLQSLYQVCRCYVCPLLEIKKGPNDVRRFMKRTAKTKSGEKAVIEYIIDINNNIIFFFALKVKVCTVIAEDRSVPFHNGIDTILRFLAYARILNPGSKYSTWEHLENYYENPDFDYQLRISSFT